MLAFYLMILVDILFVTRAGLFVNPFEEGLTISQMMRGNRNLTPLKTILGYVRVIRRDGTLDIRSYAVQNLFGNLVLFMPMGLLLPCVFRKLRTFPRTVFVTALIVVFVEITQLVTRTGACDIDDFLLNMAGCVCGYLLYLILSALIPPLRRYRNM